MRLVTVLTKVSLETKLPTSFQGNHMKTKTSRPSPSPLEAHLGFWLRYVSNHVSTRFQQLLEAEGVTVTEWVALRTLWARDEASHAELIQTLGMTKGAASKVVTRLEEKGLAQRQYASESTRDQSLVLTASGRKLVPRLAGLADANDDHFFGHLDAQERQALMNAMQALVQRHQLKNIPAA
ncbi:MarR family winged helix-turn-helix transcriptional regulator [Variovorax sp. dw_308]|uniref:MarR family winged helix-turn-helix transcriptional regulator n=1 Tax=Variovorax sp. dw_308 TaxID=2721546 RepID=UPI00210B9FA6|nr:MarR family winged helix-turn-helix transcriptional regulator [Variovorax sp. dw_308]